MESSLSVDGECRREKAESCFRRLKGSRIVISTRRKSDYICIVRTRLGLDFDIGESGRKTRVPYERMAAKWRTRKRRRRDAAHIARPSPAHRPPIARPSPAQTTRARTRAARRRGQGQPGSAESTALARSHSQVTSRASSQYCENFPKVSQCASPLLLSSSSSSSSSSTPLSRPTPPTVSSPLLTVAATPYPARSSNMPPRGSEGLDFTPILTHYLFLFTTILAVIGWFLAFIAQAIATASHGNGNVGVLWFAIFLQLFLILGVLHTLASDSISMHRFQISIFGAVAIVFAVIGVNQGIFSGFASLDAMAAGWLILAIVDILWVLYFTSEEDSLTLHVFNALGTGGLTPPSRRRRTTRTTSMHNISGGNGYQAGYATTPTGGIMPGYDAKMSGSLGGQIGSGNSYNAGSMEGPTRSLAGTGSVNNLPVTASTGVGDHNANSPLMGGGTTVVSSGGGGGAPPGSPNLDTPVSPDGHKYRAKALYSYTASADDPNEISFSKGEVLEILDKQGKWWQAQKSDGSVGIAPSNYLQVI